MPTLLSVALENHPGSLAEALEILARAEINIEAIEAEAGGEFGTLRLWVDKPKFGAELLRQDGYDVVEVNAVVVSIPNRHGELAKLSRRLADAKVNILSLFGTSSATSSEARVLLRVDQVDAAQALLGNAVLKIEH